MSAVVKRFFLRACWYAGLFRFARYLTRGKLTILCYHGFQLEDECRFRPKLFITRETFARRLEIIRAHGSPVLGLAEAVARLDDDSLPNSAVVITIDDGFYSVGSVAAGLLNRHSFPATLYLTTYYVDKGAPIFRLVVQYMFWKTQERQLDCRGFDWLSDGVVNLRAPRERDTVMWAIIDHGEGHCSEPERGDIARLLGGRLRVDFQSIADSRILSLMTPEELRQFAGCGFDVQLHTHRHRFPPEDEAAVRREIADNREAIRALLGHTARHFCYPSGIWAPNQWRWLADMKVTSATTCLPGLNSPSTPRLALTRCLDSEALSEIEFLAELYGFAELMRGMRHAIRRSVRPTSRARHAPQGMDKDAVI